MKKLIASGFILCSALILSISCSSTKNIPDAEHEENMQEILEEPDFQPAQPKTPRTLKVISSTQPQISEPAETPRTLYMKKTDGIKISSVSSPKETSKHKAFAEPFVFSVVNGDGTPAVNFEITVNYPETKTQGTVGFQSENLMTDENGTVSFLPPAPEYAFDSSVKAYPSGDVSNPEIASLAEKVSVSAPFKVRTDFQYAGGNIAIVDFSSSGKPLTNNSISSSNLLMALMKKGFGRIGNLDLTNEILRDDVDVIYKAAKKQVGNSSRFLIYGTVKYDSPMSKNADGIYSVTLNGKVTCVDLKSGEILSSFEHSETAVDEKDWNCLSSARSLLAEYFAQNIIYGL